MKLLINTLITDDRLSKHFKWERGTLKLDNRLDIFKYSLASFAAIPFQSVEINVSLSPTYEPRRDELIDWILKLWKGTPSVISNERIERQSGWRESVDRYEDDDLVWFCCNDDHIFIDYELDMLSEITIAMQNQIFVDHGQYGRIASKTPYASCYFSHFPELLAIAQTQGAKQVGRHLEFQWRSNDSVQIMSGALLRAMWEDTDYGDAVMPRPDFYTQAVVPEATFYVPLREMCRHYDGYNHVGISLAHCPPLVIPPGFFENNIKIRYGGEGNWQDFVNINPMRCDYRAVNGHGTDYKWILSDIPLFWQNRISETIIDKDVNNEACLSMRNSGMMGIATADRRTRINDFRWLQASMK